MALLDSDKNVRFSDSFVRNELEFLTVLARISDILLIIIW